MMTALDSKYVKLKAIISQIRTKRTNHLNSQWDQRQEKRFKRWAFQLRFLVKENRLRKESI